jgi:hypothetical protein
VILTSMKVTAWVFYVATELVFVEFIRHFDLVRNAVNLWVANS